MYMPHCLKPSEAPSTNSAKSLPTPAGVDALEVSSSFSAPIKLIATHSAAGTWEVPFGFSAPNCQIRVLETSLKFSSSNYQVSVRKAPSTSTCYSEASKKFSATVEVESDGFVVPQMRLCNKRPHCIVFIVHEKLAKVAKNPFEVLEQSQMDIEGSSTSSRPAQKKWTALLANSGEGESPSTKRE